MRVGCSSKPRTSTKTYHPVLENDAIPEAPGVPLTIICGFLGAGKSTLVKRILTEHHGYRIAVIMNEFGDTAVTRTINVTSPDDPSTEGSEEVLELPNGCLCCSIKDVGVAAIEKLMEKKGAFDYILLETTGLADPGPIASLFWQNEEYAYGLGKDIRLDGVVCVVDAVFGRKQMLEDEAVDGVGESLRQIACADVVLLNKVDLVSDSEVEETEQLIHKVNPAVTVHRTVRAQIDLGSVVGIDAYASRMPSNARHNHDHSAHDHEHEHDAPAPTHYEVRGITSLQVPCPVLSRAHFDRLDEWIRTVLWEGTLPASESESLSGNLEVLRCKGMFSCRDGKRYVLQGVRNIYDISEMDGASDKAGGRGQDVGVPEMGKLVFIGKGLDEGVRRSLEAVLRS
ncbi:cobW-domain-containing protein [Gloeophyllum trabeum ATCC 11539]|uniref:CobW-domain-containing protein n=1 Tax=Gloeophyllum trabeum (strain ATCC 11539 / FP-39264 / Madison 617) TaxID=670483 RepID=S7Q5H8_GLOTA|nr:cobW-domain-containing protein [Gloeophyllum trabeum ATCC 11539]EPQ54743.1 cobW-domain-containing protein [Gloeophyllum trabeum ATCC 11539]